MAVTIRFSLTEGGPALAEPLDFGHHGLKISDGGDAPTIYEIFVYHSAILPITDCKLYIAPYSDTFTGVDTAQDNYEEFRDFTNVYPFAAISLNIDKENDFPSGSWLPISTTYATTLATAADLGTIQPGSTGTSFKIKFDAEGYGTAYSASAHVGLRQWDVRMSFTSIE